MEISAFPDNSYSVLSKDFLLLYSNLQNNVLLQYAGFHA